MYPIAIAYFRCVWQVTSSGIKGSANPPLGIPHHMKEEQNFTKGGHDMETISTLLALCDGSLSVDSTHKWPVMWSFDVYFVISQNLLLSLCCMPRQAVKQTVELHLIWHDAHVPNILYIPYNMHMILFTFVGWIMYLAD